VVAVEAKTVSAVFGQAIRLVPKGEASIRVASGFARPMMGI